MADKKKDEKPKTLKAGGTEHVVKKNKIGEVIVDHSGNKGKWDKINLTKKCGSKTIKQGVKAVKSWHKNNPHRSQGR